LSSPSSQRGERSEPCFVSGNSSLNHPDSRISVVHCQDGKDAAWDLGYAGEEHRWWGTALVALTGPKGKLI